MEVKLVDHMGSDLSIVNAARVSFSKESRWGWGEKNGNDGLYLKDKDVKLIKYLATHSHWTPFAHTSITLRITAPVPIRTQFFIFIDQSTRTTCNH